MNPLKIKTVLAAGALLLAIPVFAQNEGQGQGQAVVTVLPAHGNEIPANLNQQDLTVKVNGKDSTITNWTPLRGANDRLELVVMLDSGARSSIGPSSPRSPTTSRRSRPKPRSRSRTWRTALRASADRSPRTTMRL
jgi:hypothetical protein